MRLCLSLASLALLAGCASAPPAVVIVTPDRYLPEPTLVAHAPAPEDPLAEARARVRVLDFSEAEWPPAAEWDAGAPVDRGDGILRVRETVVCGWRPVTYGCTPRAYRRADACAPRASAYHRPGRSRWGGRGRW